MSLCGGRLCDVASVLQLQLYEARTFRIEASFDDWDAY